MRLVSLTLLLAACLGATVGTITLLPDRAYAAKEQARYWTQLLKHWNDPSDVPRPAQVPSPHPHQPPAVPYLNADSYAILNVWLKDHPGLVDERLLEYYTDCFRQEKGWNKHNLPENSDLRWLPVFRDHPVSPRPRPLPPGTAAYRVSSLGFSNDYSEAVFTVEEWKAQEVRNLGYFLAKRMKGKWEVREAPCSIMRSLRVEDLAE